MTKKLWNFLLEDNSDSENNENIDWTESIEENNNNSPDEFELDKNKTLCISNPEINYEIVKDGVKIIIDLNFDNSNNSMIIDFVINKKIFMKMMKELKKK
jgi:hypothetical protein